MNATWSYRYTSQYRNDSCGAFVGPEDIEEARVLVRKRLDNMEEEYKDGLWGNRLKPNPKFEITEMKEHKL